MDFFSIMFILPDEIFFIVGFKSGKGIFGLRTDPGSLVKLGGDIPDQTLREEVEGNIEGASASAFAAVDTPAGQVHRTHDMPFEVPDIMGRNGDPLGLVDIYGAAGAIT